jgi:hypothetical protein
MEDAEGGGRDSEMILSPSRLDMQLYSQHSTCHAAGSRLKIAVPWNHLQSLSVSCGPPRSRAHSYIRMCACSGHERTLYLHRHSMTFIASTTLSCTRCDPHPWISDCCGDEGVPGNALMLYRRWSAGRRQCTKHQSTPCINRYSRDAKETYYWRADVKQYSSRYTTICLLSGGRSPRSGN